MSEGKRAIEVSTGDKDPEVEGTMSCSRIHLDKAGAGLSECSRTRASLV